MSDTVTVYVGNGDVAPYTVLFESDAEQVFDDFIDECYPEIELLGTTIQPSRAVRECDPIAYREAFNNFTDAEYHELEMPSELEGDEMDEWIAHEIGDE